MFPIADLGRYASSDYSIYILKKTHFLLRTTKENDLRCFWNYLTQSQNVKTSYELLSKKEKQALSFLILNYCYLSDATCKTNREIFASLENKLKWVFKHPLGGIFIPLELIKSIVKSKIFQRKNFLFSLLYQLPFKEQHNYIIFLEKDTTSHTNLIKENNKLDMMLLLYLSLCKNQQSLSREIVPDFFSSIDCPLPLWDYLDINFPHLRRFTSEWYRTMKHGNKSFYHALLLNRQPANEITFLLSHAYLLPQIKHNAIDNIKVVTPREVNYSLSRDYTFEGMLSQSKLEVQ